MEEKTYNLIWSDDNIRHICLSRLFCPHNNILTNTTTCVCIRKYLDISVLILYSVRNFTKIKKGESMDEKKYVQVPRALLFDPNLSSTAKMLWICIKELEKTQDNENQVTRERVTKLGNFSVSTVTKHLSVLRHFGWLDHVLPWKTKEKTT